MGWKNFFRTRCLSYFGNHGSSKQLATGWIAQGNALEDSGSLGQALQCYETAISLAPESSHAHLSRGNVLLAQGDVERALAAYATALVHDPDYAPAYYNLGNAQMRLDRAEPALTDYARAIELNPNFADAHLAMGCALEGLGRFEEAENSYRRVLEIQPNYAQVFCGLGRVLDELDRFDEAIVCYERYVALRSDGVDGHCTLGGAFLAAGRQIDALRQYRRAIELNPLHGTARWALAMAEIPAIYSDAKEVEQSRARFAHAIADLEAWFAGSNAVLGAKAVGTKQPFFLAYHARDNRTLMQAYGTLCSRLVRQDALPLPTQMARKSRLPGKLRIGIASAQVRDHSVWIAIGRGWIENLDSSRFEVLVFHLGRYRDAQTARAQREATDFIDKPRTLSDWTQAIAEAQLDVLIFPEIGMDALTAQLAARRLVPVQMASWGHPHTTGLPTIDVFLSGESFEPTQAETHYTERLVRLPNLGVYVERLAPSICMPDLGAIELPIHEPLLLCPGATFKYSPEDDEVWVALALQLQVREKGRIVFFRSHRSWMTEKFESRLRGAFEKAGVDFDKTVCIIPTLARSEFFGLMRCATLMLDTIGFSGFNTALQGLECSLPLVAYEGEYMRGRLASGLLRRMGLDEWIATSKPEFVDKAVRLAFDDQLRLALRDQISQRCGRLFCDLEPVRALEKVLIEVTTRPAVSLRQ